jgi:hypothetical protein
LFLCAKIGLKNGKEARKMIFALYFLIFICGGVHSFSSICMKMAKRARQDTSGCDVPAMLIRFLTLSDVIVNQGVR